MDLASISVGMLMAIAVFALVGIRANRIPANGTTKRSLVLSLGLWSVVMLVGLAVWLIARSQI